MKHPSRILATITAGLFAFFVLPAAANAYTEPFRHESEHTNAVPAPVSHAVSATGASFPWAIVLAVVLVVLLAAFAARTARRAGRRRQATPAYSV